MNDLFYHELRYYIKNPKEVIYFIGLFLSVLLLIPFGQQGANFNYQYLTASILWTALIVAINSSGNSLFQRDFDSGKLESYQLTALSLEQIVLVKSLAYVCSIVTTFIVILPLAAILLNIPTNHWTHDGIGLLSGMLALSLIAAFASVTMIGGGKMAGIASLISLPLTIPIIIFGASYLAQSGDILQPSILFLWGFSLLFLPILCVAGASCIRASN